MSKTMSKKMVVLSLAMMVSGAIAHAAPAPATQIRCAVPMSISVEPCAYDPNGPRFAGPICAAQQVETVSVALSLQNGVGNGVVSGVHGQFAVQCRLFNPRNMSFVCEGANYYSPYRVSGKMGGGPLYVTNDEAQSGGVGYCR